MNNPDFAGVDFGAVAQALVDQQQEPPPATIRAVQALPRSQPKSNPMSGGGVEDELNAYAKINYPSAHYDGSKDHPAVDPIKDKMGVTNVLFGKRPALLSVEPSPERVSRPADMTRQIPRRNVNVQQNYGSPFKVAGIKQNNNHVPLRVPAVIRGVNALSNQQAGVIRSDAEFFAKQQSVVGLTDKLNEDKLDYYKRDMMRYQKAVATDTVEMQSDPLSSSVRRTRTRKPASKRVNII